MPGSSSFSSSARQQARDILSKPPFHTTPSHPPRPLAGVFHAMGRALNAVFGRPARWLYHHLLLHVGHGFASTFGGWWVWVVGALAIALGATAALLIARRRTTVTGPDAPFGPVAGAGDDPDALDRRAAGAESAGDHEAAVRLRFRAGLLRLHRRGVIDNEEAQTGRQLSARLGSPTFAALARRHEMIVFARDSATPDDAASARQDWPRVLDEAHRGHADPVPVNGQAR